MKILAIESSCDETAAAVVEDGRKVLSSVISSQISTIYCYTRLAKPSRDSRWYDSCR